MIPDKKLSVTDILDEMELSRAKAEHRILIGDMQRVDEVIREILTQKQSEVLRQENRQVTAKEKAELEREIRVQTKALTKQFVKMKKEQSRQQKSAPPPSPVTRQKSIEPVRTETVESDAISANELFREVSEIHKPRHAATSPRTERRDSSGTAKSVSITGGTSLLQREQNDLFAAQAEKKESHGFFAVPRGKRDTGGIREETPPLRFREVPIQPAMREEAVPNRAETGKKRSFLSKEPIAIRPANESPAVLDLSPPVGKSKPVMKEREAAPVRETTEPVSAPEQATETKANTGRAKADMEEINGHFGNVRMEDGSVEDNYAKTEITPKNYKELKNSRNKKIDSFVLSKKSEGEKRNETGGGTTSATAPRLATVGASSIQGEGTVSVEAVPTEELEIANTNVIRPGMVQQNAETGNSEDETKAVQQEAERRIQGRSKDSYRDEEYYSPEQNGSVSASLLARQQYLKTILIVLGAIGINSFLLSFVTTSSTALLLFGQFLLSPLMYAILNAVLLGAALAVGHDLFRNVIEAFRKRAPCRDLYYLVALVICLAVNVVICFRPGELLSQGVHLYTPVAVLILFLNFVSHYQILSKTINNFKFVSGSGEKYAVALMEDMRVAKGMTKGAVDTEPVLVKNVQTGFIDHFLTRSFASDVSDTVMQNALYIAVPVAVLLGVAGWFLTKNLYIAMTMLTGTLVLAGSFVSPVMVSFPLLDSADIVRRFNGMMPDYDTIVACEDVNALLINGSELFPKEAIRLQSVKTFQGKRIDDVIIDAASVVCGANSALRHVFLEIINNATKLLRSVDSLQYEDLMGLSAWVGEKRVLIGNRELMINHSIPVPKKEFEQQYHDDGYELVYLATEGELAAAFILEFLPDRETSDIIRKMEKNGIATIVRTVDSCITSDLLARQFQMDATSFKILPSHLHKDYDEETAPREHIDSMLGNNGSTFGYIVSLAVTKKLHGCIRLGTILYLVGTVCGIALLTLLMILGRLASFGTMQMLLFMGAFLMAYWVYEKNMRL